MSKAEDLALKTYPVVMTTLIPADEEHPLIEQDCNKFTRKAYIKGYHQAEKDLELTWEDIPEIFRISEQLKTSWWFRDNEQTKKIGTQMFWEEVLKRFKERKEI